MRSMMRNPSRRSVHWMIRRMRTARMKPISHCHHQRGHPQMDGRGRSGVISEMDGSTLYGRQGEALGQGKNGVRKVGGMRRFGDGTN